MPLSKQKTTNHPSPTLHEFCRIINERISQLLFDQCLHYCLYRIHDLGLAVLLGQACFRVKKKVNCYLFFCVAIFVITITIVYSLFFPLLQYKPEAMDFPWRRLNMLMIVSIQTKLHVPVCFYKFFN